MSSRLSICKECGKRHDRRVDVCGPVRADLIFRDAALARVAELEEAFVSDLGSYHRCLYCCERWDAKALASHHDHCVLSTRRSEKKEGEKT